MLLYPYILSPICLLLDSTYSSLPTLESACSSSSPNFLSPYHGPPQPLGFSYLHSNPHTMSLNSSFSKNLNNSLLSRSFSNHQLYITHVSGPQSSQNRLSIIISSYSMLLFLLFSQWSKLSDLGISRFLLLPSASCAIINQFSSPLILMPTFDHLA